MATAHLHAGIVQRSKGGSAVGAAAYAARVRLLDQRTGIWHDYSDGRADVMHEGVYLPKGAPAHLRDLSAFANALEANEKYKNGQTARKFVVALPAELTEQQRLWLLQDYGKENFTRKGLAYHAAIHRPHAHGDDRNFHAHITVSMRKVGPAGFAETKDVESDRPQALAAWRTSWGKMTNHHLERHGHEARIDMRTLEAQGIDRMPQIHLGQHAAAAERKGIRTERGDRLRVIINDNDRLRIVENEQKRTVGKEFEYAAGGEAITSPPPASGRPLQQPQQPQDWTTDKLFARDEIKLPQPSNENRPENIDRDAEAAKSQDAIDSAGIAHIEERRQQLHQTQATERDSYQRHGEEMKARHAATWGEAIHRHAVEMAEAHSVAPASYQPGTMDDAGEAAAQVAATGLSFFLGLFASLAESAASLASPSRRRARQQQRSEPAKPKPETQQERQKRDQHQQEMNAIAAQQTHERESYERRRTTMLQDQQRAREHFEQNYADPSAMGQAFDIHSKGNAAADLERMAARKEARQERERGGPEIEGRELKP